MATKRTTHRSTSGKKLYAVRDAKGRFKDIQTFERAHRADLAKKSGPEKKTAAKKKRSNERTACRSPCQRERRLSLSAIWQRSRGSDRRNKLACD